MPLVSVSFLIFSAIAFTVGVMDGNPDVYGIAAIFLIIGVVMVYFSIRVHLDWAKRERKDSGAPEADPVDPYLERDRLNVPPRR